MIHSRLFLFVMVLGAFISTEVFASPRGITISDVDNQTDLPDSDATTLRSLVKTAFEGLSPNEYMVKDASSQSDGSDKCDESCHVQNAQQAGNDFLVYITLSKLGGNTMVLLKLYDTRTGQLLAKEVTEGIADVGNLVAPVEQAADRLKNALTESDPATDDENSPTPFDTPGKSGQDSFDDVESNGANPFQESSKENKGQQGTGTVIVTSVPTGADVLVGGRLDRKFMGKTPFTTELHRNRYRIVVKMEGYKPETIDFRLYPGEIKEYNVNLSPDNVMKAVGFAFIGAGILSLIPATVLFVTDNNVPGIIATAAGGAFFAVGIPLVIVGKKKERRAHKEKLSSFIRPSISIL